MPLPVQESFRAHELGAHSLLSSWEGVAYPGSIIPARAQSPAGTPFPEVSGGLYGSPCGGPMGGHGDPQEADNCSWLALSQPYKHVFSLPSHRQPRHFWPSTLTYSSPGVFVPAACSSHLTPSPKDTCSGQSERTQAQSVGDKCEHSSRFRLSQSWSTLLRDPGRIAGFRLLLCVCP